MNIQENQIIGELVAHDYRTASVFKNHGIDFCCNGNRTIADACESKKMESSTLIEKLQQTIQQSNRETADYNSWPLDLLTDYIEKKHHRYVAEKTQEIRPYLDKICKVHGEHHPELFKIRDEFFASSGELAAHMKKEEFILFPFIRKMTKAKQGNVKIESPHFGTIQSPIHMMMNEHTNEGDRFRIIEELSNQYTPPSDACNTYRVTFALLKEFEQDLHLHIHLENNILFPKSIELERSVL